MLVKRERKMVEQKSYSLGSEEIECLSTTAQIMKRLYEEGYTMTGEQGIFDYCESISLINTIIWENNNPQITEWEVE